MELFITWIVAAAAIGISAWLIPGVTVTMSGALIAAVALGLVNAFIRPIILFVTLPINILTLGLFTFVINAALILLVSQVVPGFRIETFWLALLFSVVLTVVNMVLFLIIPGA